MAISGCLFGLLYLDFLKLVLLGVALINFVKHFF